MSNTFNTLTIDGKTYEPRDTTKVPLPSAAGADGQLLAKSGGEMVWINLADDVNIKDLKETLGTLSSKLDTLLTEV